MNNLKEKVNKRQIDLNAKPLRNISKFVILFRLAKKIWTEGLA